LYSAFELQTKEIDNKVKSCKLESQNFKFLGQNLVSLIITITPIVFIENCLVNTWLIMITTKANICLLKFVDAD